MHLIKRYSVFFYFLLTFLISWGGLIHIIGGFKNLILPANNFNSLLPLVILVILAGPSLSGLLMTTLVEGKGFFKKYKASLTLYKVNTTWLLISILIGPLVMASTYLTLSLFSDNFIPAIFTVDDKFSYLMAGIITGLAAGIFEEIGWTGFAVPQLLKRFNVLKAGFIVGLIWSLWHTLPGLWLGYASGTVTNLTLLSSYFADSFLFLVVYRIFMVWVYKNTNSLSLAILMHFSLTSAARLFTPMGIVGIPLLLFDVIWLLVMASFITIVFRKPDKNFTRD